MLNDSEDEETDDVQGNNQSLFPSIDTLRRHVFLKMLTHLHGGMTMSNVMYR